MVRQLAAQGCRREMAARSFRAFHAPRMDYLNLYRTPELTIKLYDIQGAPGFLVQPHTHRHPFQTWVLSGQMWNISFREDDGSDARAGEMDCGLWTRLQYRTPLRGQLASAQATGNVRLFGTGGPVLLPGGHYFLDDETAHTICVPADSVLLLFQYRDVPKDATVLYTSDGKLPDMIDLYQPYPEDLFTARLERILELAGADEALARAAKPV